MKKEEVLTKIVATEFKEELESNPDKALESIKEMVKSLPDPLKTDVWVYRTVVLSLGLAVIFVIIGAIGITLVDKTTPDILIALGSAAVGALAGLLAPTPSEK